MAAINGPDLNVMISMLGKYYDPSMTPEQVKEKYQELFPNDVKKPDGKGTTIEKEEKPENTAKTDNSNDKKLSRSERKFNERMDKFNSSKFYLDKGKYADAIHNDPSSNHVLFDEKDLKNMEKLADHVGINIYSDESKTTLNDDAIKKVYLAYAGDPEESKNKAKDKLSFNPEEQAYAAEIVGLKGNRSGRKEMRVLFEKADIKTEKNYNLAKTLIIAGSAAAGEVLNQTLFKSKDKTKDDPVPYSTTAEKEVTLTGEQEFTSHHTVTENGEIVAEWDVTETKPVELTGNVKMPVNGIANDKDKVPGKKRTGLGAVIGGILGTAATLFFPKASKTDANPVAAKYKNELDKCKEEKKIEPEETIATKPTETISTETVPTESTPDPDCVGQVTEETVDPNDGKTPIKIKDIPLRTGTWYLSNGYTTEDGKSLSQKEIRKLMKYLKENVAYEDNERGRHISVVLPNEIEIDGKKYKLADDPAAKIMTLGATDGGDDPKYGKVSKDGTKYVFTDCNGFRYKFNTKEEALAKQKENHPNMK